MFLDLFANEKTGSGLQDKDGCLLPRDQLSVPNFASLQAQAQQEEELEELENSACFIPAGLFLYLILENSACFIPAGLFLYILL